MEAAVLAAQRRGNVRFVAPDLEQGLIERESKRARGLAVS